MYYFKETLVSSWQESIALLRPRALGLLLFISLRSLVRVYQGLLAAWFLPIIYGLGIVGLIYLERLFLYHSVPKNITELSQAVMVIMRYGSALVYLLLSVLYIALLARAARPSIDYKSVQYWSKRELTPWILFGTLVLLIILPHLLSLTLVPVWIIYIISFITGKVLLLDVHTWMPSSEGLRIVITVLSPFVILFSLFMYDAQQTFWQYFLSFWRSIGMLLYNYPAFLGIYELMRLGLAAIYFLSRPIASSHPWVHVIGWIVLFWVIIPYYVCVLTNIYTKRLHEQFSLYYRG